MKSRVLAWITAIVGGLLVVGALLPTSATSGYAAPLLAITSTAVPPTFTPVPTNTPVPPTATPTEQPGVTPTATDTASTPVPPSPVPPTRTPPPPAEPGTADPLIEKRVSQQTVRVGDPVDFTLTVTNIGDTPAEAVVVNDQIPDSLDIVNVTSSRGAVVIDGRTIRVDIGQVAPGEVITIGITTRVNTQAQPPLIINTATITTTSSTDNPNNNSSTVSVTLLINQPTPGAPTATPTLTPTPGGPAPAPSPTPVTPIRLPPTGSTDGGVNIALLVIGLIALGASLLIRKLAR